MADQKIIAQNLLYAVGIAVLVPGVVAGTFVVLEAIERSSSAYMGRGEIAPSLDLFKTTFLGTLLFYAPVILVITFAILQRLRIKR